MRLLKLFLLMLVMTGGARAAEPSPALQQRAAELVTLLKGETPPSRLFAPAFLAAVPEAQMNAIVGELRHSYGAARSLAGLEAATPYSGTLHIAFDKAILDWTMSVEPAPPHLVTSLLLVGTGATSGDTLAAVAGDLKALPGDVSVAVARLGTAGPEPLLMQEADRPMAVGSAFKLWVLAELVREVKAGERRWSDVVPLGRASLPFSTLRTWPEGSPITLHTLAALMISQSDNSAADTLLALLGREKVEGLLLVLGVGAPERDRPLLSTREAAILKADPALRTRWMAADTAGRRALLAGEAARADLSRIDLGLFDQGPLAVREVEWFASAADLVRTLDWLRRKADPTALAILAINPGLPPATKDFAYAGFKGGSESGVLNLSFLLRGKDGRWTAVAVTWNNPAAKLDEGRLALLVSRLLPLLRHDDVGGKTR
jgi:hypothetical protein